MPPAHKENRRIYIGFLEDFGGVSEHIKHIIKHSKYKLIPLYPPQHPLITKYTYLTIWCGLDPLSFMVIKNSKNFDILHVHGAPYLARYASKWKSDKNHYIQTFHGIHFKENFSNEKLWKFKEKENKILIESAKKADVVISVAHWLAEVLEEEYGLKSIYIPNGVDVKEFEKITNKQLKNIRGKYKLPREYFLFAGKLHKHKRPEMIIKLAEKMKDKTFVMVGKDINKNTLEQYMGRKLPENVIPLGNIPRDDYVAIMKMSRVFIFPSKNEIFGIVLLEAMASKKVVVAANNAGPAEIVRNEVDGYLFEPDNIDDLEEKALKAWENPQLGENGYKHVREKYDWRIVIKKIDKIYSDLL